MEDFRLGGNLLIRHFATDKMVSIVFALHCSTWNNAKSGRRKTTAFAGKREWDIKSEVSPLYFGNTDNVFNKVIVLSGFGRCLDTRLPYQIDGALQRITA